MPKFSPLGTVHTYTWYPSDDIRLPKAGDLYVTTLGVGYLVAHVRRSGGMGTALGTYRITVVVVDPDHPEISRKKMHEWPWKATYRRGVVSAA